MTRDPPTERSKADLVLRDARFYTLDPALPWADCIAIGQGRILAVGSSSDIEPFVDRSTEFKELGGRMVLPGIIDAHCHVFEGARSRLFEIEISPIASLSELLGIVEAAASKPGRRWITGGTWGPALAELFATESALRALDEVSADRPVVLRDVSFHSRFANSVALAAAGIRKDTRDPPNGVIVRDPESGVPTGLLHEAAAFNMDEAAAPWSEHENLDAARSSIALYNGLGVTGFQLAVASRATMSIYKMVDDAGGLSARIGMTIAMEAGLAQARDGIGPEAIATRKQFASPHIDVDFAKFFMDGVPSMRTAAFVEPYLIPSAGQARFRGQSFYSVADLADRITSLDREGISVKIHAIGDQAIRDTLDAIAIVRANNGTGGPQHQIAHLNFIAPSDLPRLRELNVLADLCPPMWFPSAHMQSMSRLLGPERVERSWPIRSLLELGTDAAAGTDWPAIAPTPSPWPGLSAMVTRRNPYSHSSETHSSHEALDLATAIELYTSRPARALRIDDRAGSLSPGKSADMIVLDRNLFEIAPEAIAETKVLATLFEGRCVHGTLELS
ncbi:amidohydrolase [Bradyrhizobium mercantei]|uniref:amidohydrolase n=1 Tax=Bradyrhizobium mercantei TaxID=1904807 RepID=UPI000977F317|nr:amidohydrolase [Bradyrhizobium mercantei]